MQRLRELTGGVKYRQYRGRFRANLVDDHVGEIRDAELPRLGVSMVRAPRLAACPAAWRMPIWSRGRLISTWSTGSEPTVDG